MKKKRKRKKGKGKKRKRKRTLFFFIIISLFFYYVCMCFFVCVLYEGKKIYVGREKNVCVCFSSSMWVKSSGFSFIREGEGIGFF